MTIYAGYGRFDIHAPLEDWPMAEVHPDVLAQLHRIHHAVNDGTLDKDTVNDALAMIHHLLTGGDEPDIEIEVAEPDEAEPPPKPRARKKR